MITQPSKVCKDCASMGKFRWLPCVSHSDFPFDEDCVHDFVSVFYAENYVTGLLCHDCGKELELPDETD